MLQSAKTFEFELKYGLYFTEVKTEEIGADLEASNFLPETCFATCLQHIWIAKTMLRCPAASNFVHNEALNVIEVSHLHDKANSISSQLDMATIHCLKKQFLTNLDRPKEKFLYQGIHKAGA